MKRLAAILLALMLAFSSAGCAANTPQQTGSSSVPVSAAQPSDESEHQSPPKTDEQPPVIPEDELVQVDFAPTEPVPFEQMMQEISEEHRAEIEKTRSLDTVKQYYTDPQENAALLSAAEVAQLKKTSSAPSGVSYEEAVADIDLYFRVLKYAYAPYCYFGGDEVFGRAKEEILASIEGKNRISVTNLKKIMLSALSFVQDGHFSINGSSPVNSETKRQKYHYCDLTFAKDGIGFYKIDTAGAKWYFDSCSNPVVEIDRTLTAEGELVYSPVLFCSAEHREDESTLVLRNGSKITELTAVWTQARGYTESPLFAATPVEVFSQNGLVYASLRSWKSNYLSDFYQSAVPARDANAVIVDLSGNQGGSHPIIPWIETFTGQDFYTPAALGELKTAFDGIALGQERWIFDEHNESFLANDIPIIVLSDDNCASFSEHAMLSFSTMDNTLIIGSNTGGGIISNSGNYLHLPNSKLDFQIGNTLNFNHGLDNLDGIGRKPDIWCDPQIAMQSVLQLLQKNALTDAQTAETLYEQYDKQHKANKASISGLNLSRFDGFWQNGFLYHGIELTVAPGDYPLYVHVDRIVTDSDFTVTSSNPDVLTCSAQPAGTFYVAAKQKGTATVTVDCGIYTMDVIFHVTDEKTDSSLPKQEKPETSGPIALEQRGIYTYSDQTLIIIPGLDKTINVLMDGKICTDYTFSIEDTSVYTAEKLSDGSLRLYSLAEGTTKLSITAQGVTNSFNLLGGIPEMRFYRTETAYIKNGGGFANSRDNLIYQFEIMIVGVGKVSDFSYAVTGSGWDVRLEGNRIVMESIPGEIGTTYLTVVASGIKGTLFATHSKSLSAKN